jgi:hypothetical protein
MFCVVFVFSYILQVLVENQFQDYNEVGKPTFEKIQLQINFKFKKREVSKNSLFLERIQNEYVSLM